MNLYRFVKTVGYKPLLMGQIKGLLDRYRNPETQREFAEKNKLPWMGTGPGAVMT